MCYHGRCCTAWRVGRRANFATNSRVGYWHRCRSCGNGGVDDCSWLLVLEGSSKTATHPYDRSAFTHSPKVCLECHRSEDLGSITTKQSPERSLQSTTDHGPWAICQGSCFQREEGETRQQEVRIYGEARTKLNRKGTATSSNTSSAHGTSPSSTANESKVVCCQCQYQQEHDTR